MIKAFKPFAFRLVFGLLLFAVVAAACNSNKDKKEEPAKENTEEKMEPPPAPVQQDTMKMDTADTRPVKPAD
ncbi:MAG TPA: hypothetical protein PKC72_15210 [Chitinophagaceae bacterium]|nr:hypothetical protein [Chitinophagaceae bacterium]